MNWHEPIFERGDFCLTPYQVASALVMVVVVVGGVFALLIWG